MDMPFFPGVSPRAGMRGSVGAEINELARLGFACKLAACFTGTNTMPQSLSNIIIHLIWSTKDRHPWLESDIREKMHAFLAGAVRQCGCEAYRVGGVADHVHLAVRLSRTLCVADLVKEVKSASSKWLKD